MRARFLLLTAAIFAGVLVAPASALPSLVKSIDAPWVYFYADGSSGKQIVKDPIPRAYAVDKSLVKSSFKVDFTTTPAIYHPAINVAVDIWSQNFVSNVPVKVKVTWGRQSSSAILAAASPGKLHNNFKNIPDSDLWYASALADAIAGEDIEPTIE